MTFAIPHPDGTAQPDQGDPAAAAIGTSDQQPAKVEPGKEKPGSTVQPDLSGEVPVTLDILRKVLREEVPAIVEEKTTRAFQGIQKLNARTENRIKADYQQQINDLKKANITPTEEQSRALLAATREKVLTEAEQPGPTDPATAQKPEAQELVEDPIPIAMGMFKRAGMKPITEESPSYALIDQKTDDPEVFLASVRKAIDAETARIQAQGNTRARNPVTGGTGKGAGGGGITNIKKPEDLYKIAFGG